MDYLLPDEKTMELMSKEYDEIKSRARDARASALKAETANPDSASEKPQNVPDICGAQSTTPEDSSSDKSPHNSAENTTRQANPSPNDVNTVSQNTLLIGSDTQNAHPQQSTGLNPAVLLLLYFTFGLGYNSGYGTEIYDAYRGLGGVQSGKGTFRDLNRLI